MAYFIVLMATLVLQANADVYGDVDLEVLNGNYSMTTDRKDSRLKEYAEKLGTKPEDIEGIQGHTTVGNFEAKLLDENTHEIEITVETLQGRITDKLKPGGTCELAWLDGRKFSVFRMTKFTSKLGKFRRSLLQLDMGTASLTLFLSIGKGTADWSFNFNGEKSLSLTFM